MNMILKVAGVIACMATSVAVAQAESLGIGAGTQGSQNYAVNAGLAKFLTDELGMNVRVQAYGGSGQSMPLIANGRLDLQLVPSPDASAAVLGEEPFEGRPLDKLKMVASLSPTAYGLMVRKDSPYHQVSDIKGRSITYGYTAQPTLRHQVDGILAAGGLSITDMTPNNVPSVPNGVDDFIAGNADVAFFALQGGKTREAEAAVGIRWLSVPNTPEAQTAMQKFVPTSYIKVIPAGAVPGVAEPTPMMAYDYVLMTGVHVPDETIRKIVQVLYDNPTKVRAIVSAFAEFDPAVMAPTLRGLTYHPAAQAFYDEKKLTK